MYDGLDHSGESGVRTASGGRKRDTRELAVFIRHYSLQ